jgi:hypothetical protein
MTMPLFLLIILVFIGPAAAADYVLEKVTEAPYQVTSAWGSWTGFIATPPGVLLESGKKSFVLEFDLLSHGYFSEENIGHISVGIRGEFGGIEHLEGRGIIIGNVTGYPEFATHAGCGPTSKTNVIAIESYWPGDNCVLGWTESEPLKDDVAYRIQVRNSDVWKSPIHRAKLIEYRLMAQENGQWVVRSQIKVWDPPPLSGNFTASPGNVSPDLGGWWIGEVFSTHSWKVLISNLHTWQE